MTRQKDSFPFGSVAFGLLLTLGILALGAWVGGHLYAGLRSQAAFELRVVQLTGEIMRLDEVLTMSARMAAATGDPAWEARYREHEAKLTAAIGETQALAPGIMAGAHVKATDDANTVLVDLENRAFERVRADDRPGAMALLFGATYQENKQIYASGVDATMDAVRARVGDELNVHRQRVTAATGASVVLFVFVILLWTRVVLLLRRYLHARGQAESALRLTNETLERRVQERTAALGALHKELIAKEKLTSLGLLAAGIAHEINNPMSFITSNLKGLLADLRGLPRPPELDEYVDDILPATLDGVKRVNTIVADLRRFARGDVDAFVTYDLNEEVAAAARISRSRIRDRSHIELALGAVPPMMGKPQQIGQVLVNLIVNASQAGPTQGRITVSTETRGDEVVLTVADDGTGIPDEVRARLFEPFFTTKPIGEGTGLGLSVVYGIVKSHGGRVEVESQVGKGSTFRVILPPCPISEVALASKAA